MVTQPSRPKRISNSLLAALGLVLVIAGRAAGSGIDDHLPQPAPALNRTEPDTGAAGQGPVTSGLLDFAALPKKIGPAVVNISATYIGQDVEDEPESFGDESIIQHTSVFFAHTAASDRQQAIGLGSGFIVDRDGTIVTNFHVIDGAEKIKVTLADGRNFAAEILGKDPKTDIAVIKINAPQPLPSAPLGDSDRLEVGEWVMAIGDPFGLDHTVTSGIVSAKGRHIGAGPYDDFIQTDAKINPGNSGGPLVDIHGEVIGMNTAIFSDSGGNIGIGFAIPINLIKEILPQLRTSGRVVRSYVGLEVQEITPEIADALGLAQSGGALVDDVAKGGPADHAGIKTGDVIVALDGKAIKEAAELPGISARLAPGSSVLMDIMRDGEPMTLTVHVEKLDEAELAATSANKELGLVVHALTSDLAEDLGLKRAEGVVIVFVQPDSVADEAGLRQGDVITEINRQPVRDLSDYNRALADRDTGESVLFHLIRGGGGLFLAMKP